MFKIISKKIHSNAVKEFEVQAPEIAKRGRPGQFVILRPDARSERIPLTIANTDAARGTINIIFQEIGKTTSHLGTLGEGDSILDLVGPLGHPTEIKNYGTVIAIGGGVGVAEVLPVARAFKEAGNRVIGIIGARNKELLILEEPMKAATSELFVTTDDGSYGIKGFVSEVLKDLILKKISIDLVYAIGPVPMMRNIAGITKQSGIKTLVSLNPIMVDGTGMCGACRVSVGEKTYFACVDGPEFDGHNVNWDELIARLSLFKKEEQVCYQKFISEHGS
jgi:ferredoxin/flavodoxin---NADP+ reductase